LLQVDKKRVDTFKSNLESLSLQIRQLSGSQEPKNAGKIKDDLLQVSDQMRDAFEGLGFHFQHIKTHVQKFKFYVEEQLQDLQPRETKPEEGEGKEDAEGRNAEEKAAHEKEQASTSASLEQWETRLQQCYDEAQIYISNIEVSNLDQSKVMMGLLFKLGYLGPDTYRFTELFLQLMSYYKCCSLMLYSLDQEAGHNIHQTCDLLKETPSIETRKLLPVTRASKYAQNITDLLLFQDSFQVQHSLFSPQLHCQQLYNATLALRKQLEDECTLFFRLRLTTLSR
jgi:hypothetical protein